MLHEGETKGVEELLQQLLLIGGEIARRFLLKNAQEINEVAGLIQVDRCPAGRRRIERGSLSDGGL